MKNTMTKSTWKGKNLPCASGSQYIIEESRERNLKQEPWRNPAYWHTHRLLLSWITYVAQGIVLPTVGRGLLHQLAIKISFLGHAQMPVWLGSSSVEAFLAGDSRLCQMDNLS